jgi:hypothetical protein
MSDVDMIFVVGNSRSGTTMMARILGRHSQVFCFSELHVFEQLLAADNLACGISREDAQALIGRVLSIQKHGFFHPHVPSNYLTNAEGIIKGLVANASGRFDPAQVLRAVLLHETNRNGKRIPCEQTPRNLFYLEEILAAYQNARVIYMVRDPRDVLLSQKNKWRRRFLGARNIPVPEAVRSWANYHPFTIAKLWCANERVARRFANDRRMVQVKFEDLLADPEGQIKIVCAAFALGFEPDMLNVPVIGSSLGQDEPERTGVDASRMGGWRRGGLSAEEIAICQFTAGGDARQRGYSVEKGRVSLPRLAWLWMIWPAKTALAVLLNLKRTRNMVDSIKRRIFT